MEGLGAAASAMAVVELAAEIAKLCLEYSSAVKNARPEIDRLRQHTDNLKTTIEGAQQLLQSPDGSRLERSQKLRHVLDRTYTQLDHIHGKLENKLNRGRTMRRIGIRALKWPFESKDIEKIIANLQQDQDAFSATLNLDQTYVLAPLI